MPSIRHSVLAFGLAGAAALSLVPGAVAADPPVPTVCDGTLVNVVIEGDVFVPYATSCTLRGVVVRGDVVAEVDAEVVTLDRTAITGDVSSQAHRLVLDTAAINGAVSATEARDGVSITRSVVRGDLRTNNVETGLAIGSPTDATRGNVVGGTLTVSGTYAEGLVARNAVAGDLVVRDNAAAITLRRNVVRGALGCAGNDPAPLGGGNVAGSETGQCAAL
jgi:hypothetical protein